MSKMIQIGNYTHKAGHIKGDGTIDGKPFTFDYADQFADVRFPGTIKLEGADPALSNQVLRALNAKRKEEWEELMQSIPKGENDNKKEKGKEAENTIKEFFILEEYDEDYICVSAYDTKAEAEKEIEHTINGIRHYVGGENQPTFKVFSILDCDGDYQNSLIAGGVDYDFRKGEHPEIKIDTLFHSIGHTIGEATVEGKSFEYDYNTVLDIIEVRFEDELDIRYADDCSKEFKTKLTESIKQREEQQRQQRQEKAEKNNKSKGMVRK